MGRTLLIFMLSPNVDSYVNAITYTCDRMNVNSVRLVYTADRAAVGDTSIEPGPGQAGAAELFKRIKEKIEQLSNGYYVSYLPQGTSQAQLLRRQEGRAVYTIACKCLTDYELIRIDYPRLRKDLSQIIKRYGGSDNCIIDVTGASKSLSVDIFSIALAIGAKHIYTFELVPSRSRNPEDSLYPLLRPGAYTYTSLSGSQLVRESRAALLQKSLVFRQIMVVSILSIISILVSLFTLKVFGPQSEALTIVSLVSSIVTVISFASWVILERPK